MGIFDAIDISATGLTAQRIRMDLIAENLANVNTTSTPQGGPYRRKDAIFASSDIKPFDSFLFPVHSKREFTNDRSGLMAMRLQRRLHQGVGTTRGVQVIDIVEYQGQPKMVYEPQHPDANAQGYVAMPDVDTVSEMVNMISAARAYEANVTVLSAAKSIMEKALEIGR